MCCGGSNTTTSTSTVPDYLQSGIQGLIGRGESAANLPYQAPPAPTARVAPFNPAQQQAFGEIGDLQGQYKPYIDQATRLNDQGTTPLAPGIGTFDQAAYDKYSSPFTEGVIGSVNKDIDRQEALSGQHIAGQAAQADAFGGDRATIAAQAANRDLEDTRFRTIAGLRQTGYQQAQSQFNTEQNRDLAARESDATNAFRGSAQAGNLGQEQQTLGLQGAGSLLTSGTTQQQNEQAQRDIAYQNFAEQRDYPKTQANFLAGILHGYPTGSSSATTGPPPSYASQLAGLGVAGIGAYGAINKGAGTQSLWGSSGQMLGGYAPVPAGSTDVSGLPWLGSGGSGFAAGGGDAAGGDIPWGAVFEARGGMVRPRARGFARGGIAGYDEGGGVYYQPQVTAAEELGLDGALAERIRAAMANGSSRSYGGPWAEGINVPVADPRYPPPRGSMDDTVGAHEAEFPDYQGPPQPPVNPAYTMPPASSNAADTVAAHEEMSPEAMGPTEPTSATTARLMALAARGDPEARAILYPDIQAPGGPTLGPISTNPSGQVMPIGRGEPFPDLRGTAEAEAITTGKTPAQVEEERLQAQMPPPVPYEPGPTDIAGEPASEGQGIAATEAGGPAAAAATEEAAPGIAPPTGTDAPAAAVTPNGIAPPMPKSKPAAGGNQPITATSKPGKGDIVTSDGRTFTRGTLSKSVLPTGQAAVPVTVDGQPVQAPAAGQGINRTQLQTAAREAQEPTPGIPDWAIPVMQAGFAMMGGTSPFAMVNIGQGAAQGVNAYQKQRQIDATTQLKTYELRRKEANDAAMHEYRLGRLSGTKERTDAMLKWHEDQIASTNELRRQGQIGTDQWRQSTAEHRQAMERLAAEAHAQTATHQRSLEDQASQNRQDTAAKARSEFYRERVGQVSPLGTATPEQQQQIRREMDELHPLPTRDGKPAQRSWKPLALPQTSAGAPDASKLVPNTIYNTQKGEALWNGKNFEAVQ